MKTEHFIQALDRTMGCTEHLVDRVSQAAARVYAQSKGLEPLWRAVFLQKRLAWLDWHTTTQRQWQSKTRRPSRAKHHDSISIRERYVRCTR